MKVILTSLLLLSVSLVYGQETCQLTTRDQEGPYFVAGAPNTRVIAPEDEMTPDKAVILTGRVLDRSCNPINDALVEVWYAGGPNAQYTFPGDDYMWYRGRRNVDSNGVYEFRATFPGSYPGRPIPHVHYKVTTSRTEFITQLYFRGLVPRRYENYVRRRGSQFPQSITEAGEGAGRMITFDIVLDS